MPDDESEELKRQIAQLERAIQHRRQGPRSWTGARYNPIRPPPVRPSRNLKLTVRAAPDAGSSGAGGTPEGYVSRGNKLVRVASGAAPLRPVLRPPPHQQQRKQKQCRRGPVVIEGETYIRKNRGNTLVRVAAAPAPAPPPSAAARAVQGQIVSIDSEEYVRTKRGTLVRVAAVREFNKQKRQQRVQRPGARKRLCTQYLFGKCDRAATECQYSHALSAETVPICLHFQHDGCTRTGCRFSHVKANPNAPICRDFVFGGWCAKGAQCLHRHVLECPDWVEKGRCPRKRCRLPHPDPNRPRHGSQLPTAEEEDAFVRRYIQRPVFGDMPADANDGSDGSTSSEDLDDALSDDEADELLKWYDDNYDEAADK
ncbi:hypothetical protein H4R19_003306 [Coemansia spiralis]|nr:hypothetical protein H4R19_003306 [Coemansia spiralis]